MRALLLIVLGLCVPPSVLAWGNHSLLAYRALEVMPEVAAAPPVKVEPLEAFLRQEAAALAPLLRSQAQGSSPRDTQPVDSATRQAQWGAWSAPGDDLQWRARFFAAVRIAPQARFALFRQLDPLRERVAPGPLVPFEGVSPLVPSKAATQRFVAVPAGSWVAPLQVVASACDEPDYGLDIGLFEDNPGGAALAYGFGRQPFGNPAVSYSSQAPFHMGFFHQGAVFNTLAAGLTRSFAPLRVRQYAGLSALAFRTGHDYWGWRFMGLALHYVQDLSQPYHASAAPGESLTHMMWVNVLDQLGRGVGKRDMVTLQGNRHIAMEQIQAGLVHEAAQAGREGALERALKDRSRDGAYPAWSLDYPRDVVAAEAFAAGPALDEVLLRTVPGHFVQDPGYDFAASNDEALLLAAMSRQTPQQRATLETALAALMRQLGAHTRNAVRGMLPAWSR